MRVPTTRESSEGLPHASITEPRTISAERVKAHELAVQLIIRFARGGNEHQLAKARELLQLAPFTFAPNHRCQFCDQVVNESVREILDRRETDALPPSPPSSGSVEQPNLNQWTCFHCGETFTTPGSARDHFGGSEGAIAGCLIDRVLVEEGGKPERGRGLLMALRKAEDRIDQLVRELDSVENDARLWHESEAERRRLQKGHDTSWFMFLDSLEGERLVLEAQLLALSPPSSGIHRETIEQGKKNLLAAIGSVDQIVWRGTVEREIDRLIATVTRQVGGQTEADLRAAFEAGWFADRTFDHHTEREGPWTFTREQSYDIGGAPGTIDAAFAVYRCQPNGTSGDDGENRK